MNTNSLKSNGLVNADGMQHKSESCRILGEWEICSKQHLNRTVKYLVCPKMFFYTDGRVSFANSTDTFNWKCCNDTIVFNNRNQGQIFFFKDSIYTILFTQRNGYVDAVLTNLSKESSYTLGQ